MTAKDLCERLDDLNFEVVDAADAFRGIAMVLTTFSEGEAKDYLMVQGMGKAVKIIADSIGQTHEDISRMMPTLRTMLSADPVGGLAAAPAA